MAFEYGPTATGELDDLAVEMLHEVFAHGGHPMIVSTDGAGLLHAETLIANFAHDPTALAALNHPVNTPLAARTDYTVLRYLPAGAVGIRALSDAVYHTGSLTSATFLAADAQGQPLTGFTPDQLTAWQAAPVVVLAETSDEVRAWVEQYRPPGNASGVNAAPPTLIMATTAAAAITAQTYSASNPAQVVGPLVGLRDAIAYRTLRPSNSNPAASNPAASSAPQSTTPNIGSSVTASDAVLGQRWQSLGLTALVATVLIMLGALFGGLTRLRQRGKRVVR